MIVAHLSDLHLGFRAYGRMERGVDVRERDVAAAFDRAVQTLVSLEPDVVVVSGDVFDRPDPPPGAVVVLARGLELLRSSLPATPVLMVAGPRDTPRRSGDPGALAVLDAFPNVEAATNLTRSIVIRDLDLHAALVPYRATVRDPALLPEPDARARWNVLVVHGRIVDRPAEGAFIDAADWNYVALGGEHRRRRVAQRARYAGSIERVALDPWAEAADEKGFLTFDLAEGEATFHPIVGRAVVALAPIRLDAGDPERMRRRVREVTAEVPGGIDEKIVRLRLDAVEPVDLLALQGELLAGLRRRALHLAVEPGDELRAPPEAWLPADAPRLLCEALEAEAARDGLEGAAVTEAIAQLVPDGVTTAAGAVGGIETVDGEVPGVGRVSMSVRPGLTAVIGGAGRSRRGVAGLLSRIGEAGALPGAVTDLWAGRGGETLDAGLHRAVEAVAESRGLGVVDAALSEAVIDGGDAAPMERGHGGPVGAVRVDPELVAAELRAAERELRAARADAAEVAGDLQVATMDWHRERQDAETTLHAYRDRARELKARIRQMEEAGPTAPCPTCGRVLDTHYDEVLAELRDEWEAVVQDGSWWKLRWEQLEPKPPHLRELERRSVRVYAGVEAGSERVELLRARLGELEGAGAGRPRVADQGLVGALARGLGRIREARLTRAREVLLGRASRFLGRMSGGRILALTWSDGRAQLQGDAGVLSPLSEEDLAAARIAVRVAAPSLVGGGGGDAFAALVVEEPFDRLEEEVQVRTLVLLRSLLVDISRIVLVSRGDAVDASPELFDAILEVRDDAGSGPTALRPTAAGAGRLHVREPTPPARARAGRH